MNAHLQAALTYAARRWCVVPTWHLRSDGSCACNRGAQCPSAGKHPRVRDWPNVATTDETQIHSWWGSWPEANVSIATGQRSGLFVIDIDPRDGGFESIDEYETLSAVGLPATLTASTGGGGRHLFYMLPEGVSIKSLVGWMPGVDIRADGGQVVAPPSPHVSGAFYTWSSGWDQGPAVAPDELVAALLRASGGGGGSGGSGGSGVGGSGREALPDASTILDGVPEGRRNETLFRWACRLRRQLGDDEAAVSVLVHEAGGRAGLGADELDTILRSAFAQEHDDAAAWVANWDNDKRFPLTDDGNALRLAQQAGHELIWTHGRGWLVWEGQYWARDVLLRHQSRTREVVRNILASEVPSGLGADEDKAITAWGVKSQAAGRIDAMIRLSRDHLSRRDDDFDADPWRLCVANGTLDLRSGRLLPHDRDDLITRAAPVRFDETAQRVRWDAFLATILPNAEDRRYVQRAVGYTLTGVTDAKAMFILYGSGNNGKSMFVEAVRRFLLGAYAKVAPKSLIMTGAQEHPTELAGMVGVRMVTIGEEVSKRDRLRASLLKSLTGGDLVTARFMRQDYFDFLPELKLWMPTNYKPGLTDFGEAMTSRLKLIPFEAVIPPEARRERAVVLAEFEAEAPGILNWALEGLEAYLVEGLVDTPSMTDELSTWMAEDDLFAQFLDECCSGVGDPDAWTDVRDVYRSYEIWVVSMGEDRSRVGMRTLAKELKARGVQTERRSVGENKASGWRLRLHESLLPSMRNL